MKSNNIFTRGLLIIFLIYSSCNSENKIIKDEIKHSNEDIQNLKTENINAIKELSEYDAYQLIINHIISKGIAASCSFLPNNLPKDNISILDKIKVYSSSQSYGAFEGVLPNQPFYLWHLTIKVCETGQLGAISYGFQDWGIIQDGQTGEVLKDFSTFRQGVNSFMINSINQLIGKNESENNIIIDSSLIEKNRLEILKLIKVP